MSRRYTIPLSYNPVDHMALGEMLSTYSGVPHTDMVADFESALCTLTTSPFVTVTSSGSAAIHLALKALGVGQNDLVIVSTFTYVASVSPICYLNAEPVLVDCEDKTWNINPVLMEEAIATCVKQGRKPKAIIVVHTYGLPALMDEILRIAAIWDIPVLEDAAEAIGSSYHGKALGSLGQIGVLSFNNNKILTTYGGGAVLSNNKSWISKIAYWASHSRKNLPYYEHEEIGYNYRMGSLNAAAGLVQLKTLNENIETRRRSFAAYRTLIGKRRNAAWQEEDQDTFSNRWITCVLIPDGIEKVREKLDRMEIETRPLWNPMHKQPLFKNCLSFLNGTSERLFSTGICLPSGNNLTLQTIETIASQF